MDPPPLVLKLEYQATMEVTTLRGALEIHLITSSLPQNVHKHLEIVGPRAIGTGSNGQQV